MDKSKFENLMNNLNKKFQKQEVCSKKGHLGEEVQSISIYHFQTKAHCYCTECGLNYDRRATPTEIGNLNKVLNEPVTI